jgi:UDP-N-acetyl-D-mannosaminuronic acid dehydrogenase
VEFASFLPHCQRRIPVREPQNRTRSIVINPLPSASKKSQPLLGPRPSIQASVVKASGFTEAAPPSPTFSGRPAQIDELDLPEFWPQGLDLQDNQAVTQWLLAGGWKHYALHPEQTSIQPSSWAWRRKRLLDLSLVTLGLPVALPLMGLAALAIFVSSSKGDPILFRQWRPGYRCRPFQMMKFRTMTVAGDSESPREDAHRLTRLGRFLRMTSIDELPQLLNVLKGEMSLVGPRPQLLAYLPRLAPRHLQRHGVPPGITGLAQVSGRNNVEWDFRYSLDVEYAQRHSFARDLSLLLQTIPSVLMLQGVVKKGQATMSEAPAQPFQLTPKYPAQAAPKIKPLENQKLTILSPPPEAIFARPCKVCVVGMGYIGLPTAAVLASRGHHVHGVEVNSQAREVINSGSAHIVEPDLDMLVKAGVQSRRMSANAEPRASDVFILCVPTPVSESHAANLDYVRAATVSICPHLKKGNLVLLESTSPPGTTEMVAEIVYQNTHLVAGDLYFAHAPERVLPGKILQEVVQNDRIIGGIDEASTEAARRFFSTFVQGRLISCNCRTAEMAKLVENASRDVQIAFANELSMICEDIGIDTRELIEIANRHPRVNILDPGCGVGGHCIAVDPWFIVHLAKGKAPLIQAAREVNNRKPDWVVEKVAAAAERLRDPVVACFGLTYKPDIDDMRESPALSIVRSLQQKQVGRLLIVEPNIKEFQGLELVDRETAIDQADILVFLVAHHQFHNLSPAQLAAKIVIDPCDVTLAPPPPPLVAREPALQL